MKQLSFIMAVFAVTGLLFFGCGSSQENDAADVIKQHADVTEKFINNLEAANSAQDVAKAIDAYTANVQKLAPQIQSLNEKYPDYVRGKAPKGLEKEAKRMDELAARMSAAMMKTASYIRDSAVQEAMKNMGNEMSKIGK